MSSSQSSRIGSARDGMFPVISESFQEMSLKALLKFGGLEIT